MAAGGGHYPDSGPLAIAARLSFLVTALAIVIAVALPPSRVPDFVRSHYLQHFAAFYVLTLAAMAAMPRHPLRRISLYTVLFAALLEASHLLGGAAATPLVRNWVADVGGLSAALAPAVVERFRKRFPRRAPAPGDPS